MIISVNRKIKGDFYLKLKLSNIICFVLIFSVVCVAVLALTIYHIIVYLHQSLPYWKLLGASLIAGILLHFSLVAMKGLVKGVRSN